MVAQKAVGCFRCPFGVLHHGHLGEVLPCQLSRECKTPPANKIWFHRGKMHNPFSFFCVHFFNPPPKKNDSALCGHGLKLQQVCSLLGKVGAHTDCRRRNPRVPVAPGVSGGGRRGGAGRRRGVAGGSGRRPGGPARGCGSGCGGGGRRRGLGGSGRGTAAGGHPIAPAPGRPGSPTGVQDSRRCRPMGSGRMRRSGSAPKRWGIVAQPPNLVQGNPLRSTSQETLCGSPPGSVQRIQANSKETFIRI